MLAGILIKFFEHLYFFFSIKLSSSIYSHILFTFVFLPLTISLGWFTMLYMVRVS